MRKIGLSIIFLTGFLILMYPVFGNLWNEYRQDQLAREYEEQAESLTQAEYAAMLEEAEAYNAEHHPYWVPDAFAEGEAEEDEEYESILNLNEDGVMCYIEIPKIGIKIPVYHGTDDEVLAKGAGHLAGSSLPIGGASTHAVIAAHRGLPSSPLFTDLDLLEIGDRLYIYVLNQTLTYEVDQILIVDPDETESLVVTEGEDYVTLVTCTPYGVNAQRLLVRGHRVEYDEEIFEKESSTATFSLATSYRLVAAAGLLVVFLFAVLTRLYYRNKRRVADE